MDRELPSLPPWGCPEQGLSQRKACVALAGSCVGTGWVGVWGEMEERVVCKARWENVRLGQVCMCVLVCMCALYGLDV